ncbi:FRG domain-containing protein [Bartonella apis]|uniref:FRG domain-containing protein n=1 Tax=Bartonella apis TaxID=1686310 RepID=UPI00242B58F3|nr:FRG domain-containing protein [Bartonella apis]
MAQKRKIPKKIKSVSQLIKKVLSKQNDSNVVSSRQNNSNVVSSQQKENYVFCYRGQADFDWEPEPSLNRYKNGADVERKSLTELINEIPDEFRNDVTCFQRLMRSQHYGLPTRLLDVTMNPLVALFFACNNEEEQCKDGAFFTFKFKEDKILNPDSDKLSIICNLSQLSESEKKCLKSLIDKYKATTNQQALKEILKSGLETGKEIESYEKLLSFIQKEKPYFVNKINLDCLENYYFVSSFKSNKRIIAQSGAFIVSGFMDYNFQDNTEFKTKFKIPQKKKKAIIEELKKFNITEKSLFPDIDHIAAYLKRKY